MPGVAMTTAGLSERVFTWGAPPIVFGRGAFDEVGHHASSLGLRHLALVIDPGLAGLGLGDRAERLLDNGGIASDVFTDVHIEPTDESLASAGAWARALRPDGYLAIGGGSAIDTAKAMNLLATNDGELAEYLNPPIGPGRAPTRPMMPLIAVPTTAGTGAESTPVCIVGIHARHLKTGISHPALRPRLAIVDPLLTMTLPRSVTVASGMDVLCHALESYTARPFDQRPATNPAARPAYNGANPISDIWAAEALRLLGRWFRRAVDHPDNLDAREGMMLAATFAGIGFGNAGVHLPHACAYPIAGLVREYHAPGYPGSEPLVPHGLAVVSTAAAAFRFTFSTSPRRHLEAATLLGHDRPGEQIEALPDAIDALCQDVGAPRGLATFGYGNADIDAIAEGAFAQQRLLAVSPRPATLDDLASIVTQSISV